MHEIPKKTDHPSIYQKMYRLPEKHKDIINKEVDKSLKQGTISKSSFPWNSFLLCVKN